VALHDALPSLPAGHCFSADVVSFDSDDPDDDPPDDPADDPGAENPNTPSSSSRFREVSSISSSQARGVLTENSYTHIYSVHRINCRNISHPTNEIQRKLSCALQFEGRIEGVGTTELVIEWKTRSSEYALIMHKQILRTSSSRTSTISKLGEHVNCTCAALLGFPTPFWTGAAAKDRGSEGFVSSQHRVSMGLSS
jgi:hypothetical protein